MKANHPKVWSVCFFTALSMMAANWIITVVGQNRSGATRRAHFFFLLVPPPSDSTPSGSPLMLILVFLCSSVLSFDEVCCVLDQSQQRRKLTQVPDANTQRMKGARLVPVRRARCPSIAARLIHHEFVALCRVP